MEWQLTKDKAPNNGQIVLGYWDNGEIHTGLCYEGRWYPAWEHQDNTWGMPTYWQQLPEPPKENV